VAAAGAETSEQKAVTGDKVKGEKGEKDDSDDSDWE
jgi:hypothetical protein